MLLSLRCKYKVNCECVGFSMSFAVVYNILFDSLHTSSKANYLVGHSTDSLRRFFLLFSDTYIYINIYSAKHRGHISTESSRIATHPVCKCWNGIMVREYTHTHTLFGCFFFSKCNGSMFDVYRYNEGVFSITALLLVRVFLHKIYTKRNCKSTALGSSRSRRITKVI